MHPYRTLFASALVLALGATPASAAFTGPGGTSTVNSAAQVADAPDDTPCMLEGHIVERVNGEHDKYTFKDATGSVVVEIDDDLFRGRDIGPSDKVRLSGEVDKKTFRSNQVDVEWMEVITPGRAPAPAARPAGAPHKQGAAPAAGLTKAAQIAGAHDNMPCMLEGHIAQRLTPHGDRYVFKDDSGSVTVKIDGDQLRNRTLTPQTRVRLSGEVDVKRDRPTEVDVDWVEILK